LRNFVVVAGRRIPFVLHTVGDGYFDARWQGDVLTERVLDPSLLVYVPSETHLVPLLLHHIITQKRTLADVPKEDAIVWLRQLNDLDFASFDDGEAALGAFIVRHDYDDRDAHAQIPPIPPLDSEERPNGLFLPCDYSGEVRIQVSWRTLHIPAVDLRSFGTSYVQLNASLLDFARNLCNNHMPEHALDAQACANEINDAALAVIAHQCGVTGPSEDREDVPIRRTIPPLDSEVGKDVNIDNIARRKASSDTIERPKQHTNESTCRDALRVVSVPPYLTMPVRNAFVTVVNADNIRGEIGSRRSYFTGLRALHCSMMAAGISLSERPLIVLIGSSLIGSDMALELAALSGVVVVSAMGIFSQPGLSCILDVPLLSRDDSIFRAPSVVEAAREPRRGTYMKLLLFALGSAGIVDGPALYLDADALVLPKHAASSDTRSHPVEALLADDYLARQNASVAACGAPAFMLFNTGVLLFQPDRDIARELAHTLTTGQFEKDRNSPTEQDLLTSYWSAEPGVGPGGQLYRRAVAPHLFTALPCAFNTIPMLHPEGVPREAAVLHWTGTPKPWEIVSSLFDDQQTGAARIVPENALDVFRASPAVEEYADHTGFCEMCNPAWALQIFDDTWNQCATETASRDSRRGGTSAATAPTAGADMSRSVCSASARFVTSNDVRIELIEPAANSSVLSPVTYRAIAHIAPTNHFSRCIGADAAAWWLCVQVDSELRCCTRMDVLRGAVASPDAFEGSGVIDLDPGRHEVFAWLEHRVVSASNWSTAVRDMVLRNPHDFFSVEAGAHPI
jgi:hypothetical protein